MNVRKPSCRSRLLAVLLAAGLYPAFAVLPAPAAENPYGATAHITRNWPNRRGEWPDRAQTCATLAAAGVGWVRADFDLVDMGQRTPGAPCTWDQYDAAVRAAETNGVQLLPILARPPMWQRPIWEHIEPWTNLVAIVAARYAQQLPVWEIINEPDWHTNKFENATNYVRCLRAAAAAIRNVHPKVILTTGGWSNTDLPFVREAYRLGAGDVVDIHNYHIYTYPRAPEPAMLGRHNRFLKLLEESGCADKPIWVTECGWPTAPEDRRSTTEENAARWLPRGHLLLFGLGVDKVFIYEWRAPEIDDQEREDHFGIHHWDFTPKPSVRALRTLIEARPAGSVQCLEQSWTNAAATVFWPQWKRPSGEAAGAFWCHESATNAPALELTFEGNPTFRDAFGNPVPLSPETNNIYRIARSPDVLYFRGARLVNISAPEAE